ncbi:MAG TPA: UDP-N-acetylmuramate dehydrogenase, partial [Minicystis sp.]|nr:UDP-N-acetylmuramate dehydrogenase [Minicystis sp.]
VVVADGGVAGLVLRPRLRGVEITGGGARAHVRAAAGEPWDELVARAVREDLQGLECLSGIPGDVGATPIQNVGAYGQEVAETVTRVEVVDRATGERAALDAVACGFSYRDSVFKRGAKDRWIVVAVEFALARAAAPAVRYAELERALAGVTPTLGGVRETVLRLRRGKSMVLDPRDENGKSCGSFFMNPTLDDAELARALPRIEAEKVLRPGEAVPRFPAGAGRTKLAAGWLIERAGFSKGFGEGPVGLSTRHALAIVNRGGASSADVVALARRVQRGVLDRFGVRLRPEPVFLGFAPGELDDLTGP